MNDFQLLSVLKEAWMPSLTQKKERIHLLRESNIVLMNWLIN